MKDHNEFDEECWMSDHECIELVEWINSLTVAEMVQLRKLYEALKAARIQ